MADERQQPESQAGEQPTPIDPATAPEPIKEMQAKTIREIRAETVPPEKLPEGARELVEAETPSETQARREGEDALNKPIEAIEDAVNAADAADTPHAPVDVMPHVVGDKTTILGRVIPLNIYDVVFVSLAVLTVIEVITGTLMPHMWLTIVVLSAIAFVKAFHVIWFYMHLSMDNRIFWLTLLLPFFIAALGVIYLIAVPTTGY